MEGFPLPFGDGGSGASSSKRPGFDLNLPASEPASPSDPQAQEAANETRWLREADAELQRVREENRRLREENAELPAMKSYGGSNRKGWSGFKRRSDGSKKPGKEVRKSKGQEPPSEKSFTRKFLGYGTKTAFDK